MANSDDQWLKEDGYLNVDTESSSIVYHPFLNVILVIARSGEVKLLDANSGVILQSYRISGKGEFVGLFSIIYRDDSRSVC